ncbi:MAG: FtsB family cell division protein [Armatimonadota bacterium]
MEALRRYSYADPIGVPEYYPRRRAKRRRTVDLRRIGVLVSAAATAAVIAVTSAWPAYCQLREHQRSLARLEAKLAGARAERRWLLHQIQVMQTPAGLETQARALGYVRPGEIALHPVWVQSKTPGAD